MDGIGDTTLLNAGTDDSEVLLTRRGIIEVNGMLRKACVLLWKSSASPIKNLFSLACNRKSSEQNII
jgi:hypothetical protein